MIKFRKKEDMVDFISFSLNNRDKISAVVDVEILDEILYNLEFETKQTTKETDSESFAYLITKYTTLTEQIYLSIEPIMFDEDSILTEIENDFVIVQDYVLYDEDIETIYAGEELIFVDFDIEFKDEDENEENEDLCLGDCNDCKTSTDCNYKIEETYEEPTNDESDEIDEFLDYKIEEFIEILREGTGEGCFNCDLKNLLEQIYDTAYTDGRNSLALGLSDLLSEIVEQD